MRYIGIDSLEPDMILGKTLFNKNGSVLLYQGSVIKKNYVSLLKSLEFGGVYIQDKFTDEIDIDEIVSAELKHVAISKLNNFFTDNFSGDAKPDPQNIRNLEATMNMVMEQVMGNKTVQLNLMGLKDHSEYACQHSINVSIISCVLGAALGFNRTNLHKLSLSAALSDSGMKFIPKHILEKNGQLTGLELKAIQEHPQVGFDVLRNRYHQPMDVAVPVLQHHERFDGKGYPAKKSGKELTMPAKIIAIADVYDALISERPFRKAYIPSEAAEYIMANKKLHFDPIIVDTFLSKVAIYPKGICVRLNNGIKGIVVENYENFIMRPKIKILTANENINMYIDLKNDASASTLTIVDTFYDSGRKN